MAVGTLDCTQSELLEWILKRKIEKMLKMYCIGSEEERVRRDSHGVPHRIRRGVARGDDAYAADYIASFLHVISILLGYIFFFSLSSVYG